MKKAKPQKKKKLQLNSMPFLPHMWDGGTVDTGEFGTSTLLPFQTNANAGAYTQGSIKAGKSSSSSSSNTLGYASMGIGALGSVANALTNNAGLTQPQYLAGRSTTQNVVDSTVSAIPVVGSIYSAGKSVGNWAKSDYESQNQFGELSNTGKFKTADTIGMFIDPASSFISGLSGEGWTPQQRADKTNKAGAKNRNQYEDSVNQGAINEWQKNNLGYTVAAYGGDIGQLNNTNKTDYWNTDRTAWVDSINHSPENVKKDFIKRYSDLSLGDIQVPGFKGRSTHLMSSGDGYVYPHVVNINGKLTYLKDSKTASNYAHVHNEGIQFPNDEQAQWYAENGYKTGTDVLIGKPKKALGGEMLGQLPSNLPMTRQYRTGGTHEQNSMGGIPVDAMGNPASISGNQAVASVEGPRKGTKGGEVSWVDPSSKVAYVFSDRLFV